MRDVKYDLESWISVEFENIWECTVWSSDMVQEY